MKEANARSGMGLLLWAVLAMIALAVFLAIALTASNPRIFVIPVADADGLAAAADTLLREQFASPVGAGRQVDWPLWISAITLAISIIGLVSSALLGWRQEARAIRMDRLETEHLRTEMEKMRLEIEQLRRGMEHEA